MTTAAAPATVGLDTAPRSRSSGLWRDALRNILRQRNARVGLSILTILVLSAIFADVLSPYDPDKTLLGAEKRLAPPCVHLLGCAAAKPEHPFGLDANGRDEFSRVLHGARISLQVGFITVGFAIVLGMLLGLVSGYAGGWTETLIMRVMDVLLVFPALLLAIAIVAALGPGLINAQLAIGIVAIPVYARVMRASVLTVRESDFVTASRALGESPFGLIFRRILPNALTPIIVAGTLGIAGAVLDIAALSFLGLGAQPPLAEWGSMIGQDRNYVFTAPHLIWFPGLALALTVFGFNLLGDGLRDALDPRLNR
ncbi:MAG TPA: ABC transporter permease [Candidatus Limnocylindrales bacterium]|nr:ABC transporter permease [Candidatus Limnocylindrales bacterium]